MPSTAPVLERARQEEPLTGTWIHIRGGSFYVIIESQLRGWAKQCGHSHEAGYAKLSISDNTLV